MSGYLEKAMMASERAGEAHSFEEYVAEHGGDIAAAQRALDAERPKTIEESAKRAESGRSSEYRPTVQAKSRVDELETQVFELEHALDKAREEIAISRAKARIHEQIRMLRCIVQGVHQEEHKAIAQDMLEDNFKGRALDVRKRRQ